MAKVPVYRFRMFDMELGDNKISTRMATREKIDEIRAEIIRESEFLIEDHLLEDGFTEKGFEPDSPDS